MYNEPEGDWGGSCFPHSRLTRTAGVIVLILAMAAVTDAVTDQVRTDTDVGVALESLSTAECLRVLESCDDEAEPVVGGAPAVRVVAEGDVVGPGDDEPIAAHRAGLGVTRDVSLQAISISLYLSSLHRLDLSFQTLKELKIMHWD